MRLHLSFVLFFGLLWVSTVKGQSQKFNSSIYEEGKLIKNHFQEDSITIELYVNRLLSKYISNNYLLASKDSFVMEKDTLKYFLHKGLLINKVQIVKVSGSNESYKPFDKIIGKQVSNEKFKSVMNKKLAFYVNNGYPFAQIVLKDAVLKKGMVTCEAQINKGALITYDTVIIFGDVKTSNAFIKHFLGIERGGVYSEKVIKNLSGRIRTLNNVQLQQAPLVSFRKNKATLVLRLKEVQANKINALIGFAPESGNNSNKLLLTGQADIALVNLTGNREEIGLDWQSFLKNSQSLKTQLYLPFIPYINLGTTLSFGLVKFDSNYLQTNGGVAINLLSGDNFKWSIFYKSEVTSLLTADTSSIRSSFNFPTINATSIKAYGVGIEKFKWENRQNPWKGYAFNIIGSAGVKKINKDNRIERVKFSDANNGDLFTLYDSLKLVFNQFQTAIDFSFAIPLRSQKFVLFGAFNTSAIWADKIFFGDLYRLGGFKTLKGFDEQSIFANQYISNTIEFRYRFNQLSNAFIFGNTMYYKNMAENFQGIKEDFPFGFGVGANINTGNTVLSMAYGYGIQKNIPLNINQGKFHFGLVSYF